MKTIVIAEIGENHYGRWDICRAMVEEAAANGDTIAKFQTYTADQFGVRAQLVTTKILSQRAENSSRRFLFGDQLTSANTVGAKSRSFSRLQHG